MRKKSLNFNYKIKKRQKKLQFNKLKNNSVYKITGVRIWSMKKNYQKKKIKN